MGNRSPILNRLFPARYALEQAHPTLQILVSLHINQICAGHAMLGNENGFFVALKLGEQFRCLSLEGGYKFGTHASDTKVSLAGMQIRRKTASRRYFRLQLVFARTCRVALLVRTRMHWLPFFTSENISGLP